MPGKRILCVESQAKHLRILTQMLIRRGFHVLTWRQGDLGYALVSDVDERELDVLGRKIATGD